MTHKSTVKTEKPTGILAPIGILRLLALVVCVVGCQKSDVVKKFEARMVAEKAAESAAKVEQARQVQEAEAMEEQAKADALKAIILADEKRAKETAEAEARAIAEARKIASAEREEKAKAKAAAARAEDLDDILNKETKNSDMVGGQLRRLYQLVIQWTKNKGEKGNTAAEKAEHEASIEVKIQLLKKKLISAKKVNFYSSRNELLDSGTPWRCLVCPLPFRVDGSTHIKYSGVLREVILDDANAGDITLRGLEDDQEFAFLTKDGTVRQCSADEAKTLKASGAILYLGERQTTWMWLCLATAKDVDAINSSGGRDALYPIELQFTDTGFDRPYTWGYFKLSAFDRARWQSSEIRNSNLTGLQSSWKDPDYFITKDAKASCPNLFTVRLKKVLVRNEAGVVIGEATLD